MDTVLHYLDDTLLTSHVYPQGWKEDNLFRQFLTLMVVVTAGGYLLYFLTAALNYYFVFDHRLMKHPLFLPNQVKREILVSVKGVPLMGLLSTICFLLEVRGYSRLLDTVDQSNQGWWSIPLSIITFVLFTDCLIYWIHRGLHAPWAYRRFHKTHHLWKITTPFASHAFDPIDGFLQSSPYHLYVFLFPMNKFVYLAMFFLVNIWTVSIHDGDYRVPKTIESMVNGSAHHTDHHLFYNYNYGQFFTLWDRLGGTFRYPSSLSGSPPINAVANRRFKSN